jgi:hypothetical protein
LRFAYEPEFGAVSGQQHAQTDEPGVFPNEA